jgi:hypothetical protein
MTEILLGLALGHCFVCKALGHEILPAEDIVMLQQGSLIVSMLWSIVKQRDSPAIWDPSACGKLVLVVDV